MQDKPLSQDDYKFLDTIQERFTALMESNDEMLELEPMNSYQRRLVHKVASNFKLKSHSVGEEERYVCAVKTQESLIPEKKEKKNQRIFDYGAQSFFALPETELILKTDGSIGILRKADRNDFIDKRIIPTREFRIRQNKIVCQGEKEW